MSQNACTLHLFFEDAHQLKLSLLAYQQLIAGNTKRAKQWLARLGNIDLDALWDSRWFNLDVISSPTHLLLRFETHPHDALPFRVLEALFAHGLKSAVLRVSYGHGGKAERLHCNNGLWVSRATFFSACPDWLQLGTDFGGDAHQSIDPVQPTPIASLRQAQARASQKHEAMVQAFLDATEPPLANRRTARRPASTRGLQDRATRRQQVVATIPSQVRLTALPSLPSIRFGRARATTVEEAALPQ